MIRSMTGFASVERQYDFGRLTWELRSVNHRYLEIGFRVPEEFRVLEPDIRRILGEFLSRGKVDATLRTSDEHVYALGDCAEVNGKVLPYILPLMAYFADLAQDPPESSQASTLIFILLGLAGAAAALMIFDVLWKGRFRAVRRPLVAGGEMRTSA